MAIETADDYQKKETRLNEIEKYLEGMTKEEKVDIQKVVKLRDEAIVLVGELKAFLKNTFEPRS